MRRKLEDLGRRRKNSSPSLGKVVSEIDEGEKLLIGGDLNGHVGAGVEGFEGVQWCMGGLGLEKETWKVK